MAKVKVTLSVDESLRNRVAMLAAVEERNFSQMWGVLIGEALAERDPSRRKRSENANLPPVFPRSLEPEPDSSEFFPSKPVSAAKTRRGKCVHQIPADVFCKWGCDSE